MTDRVEVLIRCLGACGSINPPDVIVSTDGLLTRSCPFCGGFLQQQVVVEKEEVPR